ncbi:outer membrane protein assembly factor BamB family protein [Halostella salina]|uniref:outer membrane protein assembly factor BamB family protein n=1 Tax=Halostella salina TaxID=1547897 RepID=UPI000EF81270|nr:PQQ-binding-like beta-propeller repeat protein [Halostella salina]
MVRYARREFLTAAAAAGVVSAAGCTDSGSSSDGGGFNTETPEADAADNWRMRRGGPGNAGVSSSGGPGGDADAAFTAEFRNGINLGYGAPTVGEDAIYGVGRVATPYEMEPRTFGGYAFRLSREAGSEEWRVPVELREGEDNLNFFPNSPKTCLGPDGLYVTWIRRGESSQDLVVQAHARDDGSRQWRNAFPGAASALEPVVDDGTLYLLGAARLLALSTADGSREWASDEFRYDQTVPSVGADAVVVANRGFADEEASRQVTAFDRADGSVRWSEPTGIRNGLHRAPSVVDGTVYLAEGITITVGAVAEELPPFSIRALDAADGSEGWSHTYKDRTDHWMMAGGTTSVAVDGSRVYYGLLYPTAAQALGRQASEADYERFEREAYTGASMVALDRADGSVVWTADLGNGAQVYSYLVVDDDYVYAKRLPDADPERRQWVAVEKASGEVAGRFGSGSAADGGRRAFGVADGALYEHVGDGVRVWR